MAKFRSLRRLLVAVVLSLCAAPLLALLASQFEQHVFRRRAELLLSQVQSLELRKTPWQDAQIQVQRWNANREFRNPCDDRECSVQITLSDFVLSYVSQRNVFIKSDDYLRWRLKLTYTQGPFERIEESLLQAYVRLGGHPARVTANIGMRNGLVWSKGFEAWIETYGHPIGWSGNWRGEFTLIASAHSASRLERPFGDLVHPQLMLHPNYVIGGPSGCTICVAGWTTFTPYAAPADVRRLMQLDLACLTRWHPCVTQSDIMPDAWAQYLAERPLVDGSTGNLACSPSFLEILGRDSVNIAMVDILRHYDKVDREGYDSEVVKVRLLERLKGVADWTVGETRNIHVSRGNDNESIELISGRQLILFRGRGPSTDTWILSVASCPIAWANESNLSRIRIGVAEDYGALDKGRQE